MENLTITTLLQHEKSFENGISEIQNEIEKLQIKFIEAKKLNDVKETRNNETKKMVKSLKREIMDKQNGVNESRSKQEMTMADNIFKRIVSMESEKKEGLLPNNCVEEIKQLYLLLSRQGRLNVRYLKLPKSWLKIGM